MGFDVVVETAAIVIKFFLHRVDSYRKVEKKQKIVASKEHEEEFVVVSSNTVSDPRTVVVVPLHTIIALMTVRSTQRSEYLTRLAVLEFEESTLYVKGTLL